LTAAPALRPVCLSLTIPRMSKTVLVIDDSPEARYPLARMLRTGGYDIRETATGRDGFRLARLRPDLIVLDIAPPDIDGFEVVRQLKRDTWTCDIPVLHKTAVRVDAEDGQRVLASGADETGRDHPQLPESIASVSPGCGHRTSAGLAATPEAPCMS
jgi:CheY-like chemotaxis protein